ncbi:MAG: hypothetical protein C0621_10125 [Desulfuromonas sp.]|nr:MAG: hypothetical protein C0621_10125 [Desulfuromonas sp.]
MHLLRLCLIVLCLTTPWESQAAPLRYAGATTLQRDFMPEATRLYEKETGTDFRIQGGNTVPGLRALLNGDVEIAGAGRFLSVTEKEAGLVETLIGWDAMSVIVHRDNPVSNLTLDQLRNIFSGSVQNWREVGGQDQAILVVATPPGSGMRSMSEQLILKGKSPLTSKAIMAPLVHDADQQVARFPMAITVLSQSMLDADGVKRLPVDGMLPEESLFGEGGYPLVKPLLLVTRSDPDAATAAFIRFALSDPAQQLLKKKFYPLKHTLP